MMTGQEFEQLMVDCGHGKTSLATLLGMTRQAIGKFCKAEKVPTVYEYALKAVAYEKQAAQLANVIKLFNEPKS